MTEIEILMMDGCTKHDAEIHLKRGTVVFEDFEEFFDSYMQEWEIEDEDVIAYKRMITHKIPAPDWGIVEADGKTYYIEYVL